MESTREYILHNGKIPSGSGNSGCIVGDDRRINQSSGSLVVKTLASHASGRGFDAPGGLSSKNSRWVGVRMFVMRVHPVMRPSLAINPALHLQIKDLQFPFFYVVVTCWSNFVTWFDTMWI